MHRPRPLFGGQTEGIPHDCRNASAADDLTGALDTAAQFVGLGDREDLVVKTGNTTKTRYYSDEFTIEPTGEWKSPHSGATYPSATTA